MTKAIHPSCDDRLEQRLKWYALQVRPTKEGAVHRSLEVKGYDTLLPMSRIQQRARSGTRVVRRALFPGYLFCRLNLQDNQTPVLFTSGVIDLVGRGIGGLPVPLSDSEIDAISRVSESGAAAESWPSVHPGDEVELVDGPLCGLRGVIVANSKATHLVISVEMLQRSIALQVPPEWAYVVKANLNAGSAARFQ